uniref:Putative replication protein n=1 Tax=viral metagenome TaxID=1070528 RepID=A0A6H1ZRG6_9ZZZZ
MGNDPAFLFYPGDYLRDTQCLGENTQVAYDRIMCEHMRNICITQKQLKFFTKRLNEDEKEELMFTLTKINGGYQIEWVALSIVKRKAYSESRRKNSTKKEEIISKTYDNHMDNEIKDEDKSINESGIVKEIIEDLNFVLGSDYRTSSNKTKEFIKSRLNEGFTLDDFKIVHRKMLKSWGNNPEMCKYLRPITLYSNKFESYRNQMETSSVLNQSGIKAYLIGQEWLKKHGGSDVK